MSNLSSGSAARALLLARAVLVTVAVAAGAWISVPLVGAAAPFTLQTLAVVLAAPLAGPAAAALGLALYLGAGAAGLPVFAGGSSGAAVLAGPTAGFLWAFLLVAPGVELVHRRFPVRGAGGWFVLFVAAQGSILLLGFCWLMLQRGLADPLAAVLPLLPGLLLKSVVATGIVRWRERRRPAMVTATGGALP